MNKALGLLAAAATVAAFALPPDVQAQEITVPDISGQWELTREGGGGGRGGGGRGGGGGGGVRGGGGGRMGGGGGGPSAMMIEQNGNTFTGTLEMRMGPSDIQEGKIDGNTVSFRVTFETPRGAIEMIYTGTIDGDGMSGTLTGGFGGGGGGGMEAQWTAKRVET